MAETSTGVREPWLRSGDAGAIKAQLLALLGDRAEKYWASFRALCTGGIDSVEFHAHVQPWLPDECSRCFH